MAVNSMQITDVYEILNSLHQQATGRASIAPTNTGEFVSMATTTLAVGTDQIYNTLMQYPDIKLGMSITADFAAMMQ